MLVIIAFPRAAEEIGFPQNAELRFGNNANGKLVSSWTTAATPFL
jgi:hypothetical protein